MRRLSAARRRRQQLSRRWQLGVLAACAVLLEACTAPPATALPPLPTGTSPPRQAEIRFALVGEPTDVNVWALFEDPGARYANYAVRRDYWPRLLAASFPSHELIAMAADRMPAAVAVAGDSFVGTVTLRSDLAWTDGSPFTAEDVAFTVNTALQFELGADWGNYYRSDLLERAEALDARTVKFLFRSSPDVGDWQYGALQGPVVQRAYWEKRIAPSSSALPDASFNDSLAAAQAQRDQLQKQVDQLNAQLLALRAGGGQDRELEMSLRRRQGDLDAANNALAELSDLRSAMMTAARGELFSLEDDGEPTLGVWRPASAAEGVWLNLANPAFPFSQPRFERASYRVFGGEDEAVRALLDDEVDAILAPDGLSPTVRSELESDASVALHLSPSSRLRFLALNPMNAILADGAVRRAIACLLREDPWPGQAPAMPGRRLDSFVPGQAWKPAREMEICPGAGDLSPRERAVETLMAAGYTWSREPAPDTPGEGLTSPEGRQLPSLGLLVADSDSVRLEFAAIVQRSLAWAGIRVVVSPVREDAVHYSVLSSGDYDLALLGWRADAFPGYLCDWFGEGGTFDSGSARLHDACRDLAAESDMEAARGKLATLQSILIEELPMIPAYAEMVLDAYRHLDYPEAEFLDGISGNYGAPTFALPAP